MPKACAICGLVSTFTRARSHAPPASLASSARASESSWAFARGECSSRTIGYFTDSASTASKVAASTSITKLAPGGGGGAFAAATMPERSMAREGFKPAGVTPCIVPAGPARRRMLPPRSPPGGGTRQDGLMAHERAGQVALPEDLIDVDALIGAYYDLVPNPDDPDQQVVFGTSGHRGSSLDAAFNDAHIAATTQAIVEYRAGQGITGPALHRQGHPRPLRAGLAHRHRGAARPRRHHPGRARRRLHPHAGRLPGDHRLQQDPRRPASRRHRGHPVPQSAPRRRLQVQPAARRTCRHRRHQRDRSPRQRTAPQPRCDPAHPVRACGCRRHPRRLPGRLLRGPAQRARPGRDRRGRRPHRRRPPRRRRRAVLAVHLRSPRTST